jgi:hypothetical protein
MKPRVPSHQSNSRIDSAEPCHVVTSVGSGLVRSGNPRAWRISRQPLKAQA